MISAIILSLLVASPEGGLDPVQAFDRPLGLQLLQSRLQQVETVVGARPSTDSELFACFVTPTHDLFLRFLLVGHPGSERIVSGFTMRNLAGGTAAPCVELDAGARERLDLNVGGIRLGMSRSAVRQHLRPDFESRDGKLFRQVTSSDRDIVISASFQKDALSELTVQAAWRHRPTTR